MWVYVGLKMIVEYTWSRFPCFLLVSRVRDISSGIGPCFPLAGGLCKLFANAWGKWQIQRQPLLVQQKQQANPLWSTHKYTRLVISGNVKNKPRPRQDKEKPMHTRINRKKYVNGSVNSERHLKSSNRHNAYSGLNLSIYVLKRPIQLWVSPFTW